MTKEQMIMEGADRLEALGLSKAIISKHLTAGTVYVSNPKSSYEPIPVTEDSDVAAIIKGVEQSNCHVYHVITSDAWFGTCLNMLTVSSYDEDQEIERAGLKRGLVSAYVENLSAPNCSEFGTIAVKRVARILVRTDC